MTGEPGEHGAPIPARAAAAWVARRLRDAGHRALFAGGCVRDQLLGLEPADYDVATDAVPEQVRAAFPRAIGVGESFGVMLVRHGGRTVEVATFRADGSYADGRRPDGVRFSDDREDAMRRDFTINGLFEDPETGAVIDHVGGRADLQRRILRAIGDPDARLSEDRLRALRAVRFAARFSLSVDPATEAAVRRVAHDLRAVSRERIGHEMRRMLAHATRARAVSLVGSMGLAPAILAEPDPPAGSAVRPSVVAALPAGAPFEEALAAWMIDRTPGGAIPIHEVKGRVNAWRRALSLSNGETDAVRAALELRAALPAAWPGGDRAARKRLAASAGFGAALALLGAEGQPVAGEVARDLPKLVAEGVAPPPFVDGDDLVAAGLPPGPRFKAILDAMYDRQLNLEFADREHALRALAAPGGPLGAGAADR